MSYDTGPAPSSPVKFKLSTPIIQQINTDGGNQDEHISTWFVFAQFTVKLKTSTKFNISNVAKTSGIVTAKQ